MVKTPAAIMSLSGRRGKLLRRMANRTTGLVLVERKSRLLPVVSKDK